MSDLQGGRSSEALMAECAELDRAMAALNASYEKYFLGLERKAPRKAHQDLVRRVLRLKETFTSSTQVRFRVGSLQLKLQTYERLWERTLKEMEEGTYQRDLFKAKLHDRLTPKEETPPALPQPEEATKVPSGAELSDAQVKALFDAYVAAKERCNEDTSKLTVDALGKTLRKQVPEILKKHRAQHVEFKVIIKDGKAQLRAVPQEKLK